MSEVQDRERIVGEHVRLYGLTTAALVESSRSGRDRADSVGSILYLLADLVHRLPDLLDDLAGAVRHGLGR